MSLLDPALFASVLDIFHSVFVEGDAEPHLSVATMAICSILLLAIIGIVQTQRPRSAVKVKAIGRMNRC